MKGVFSVPASAETIAEDTTPQIPRIRTNGPSFTEFENNAQFPPATIPRELRWQPMPTLARTITNMSRNLSSNTPSDLSITSTAVSPTEVPEEQTLKSSNNLQEVSKFLDRQETVNREWHGSLGKLEEENRQLREQLKSSDCEKQCLKEDIMQKNANYDNLVSEKELFIVEAGKQIHEKNKEITLLKQEKQQYQTTLLQLEQKLKAEVDTRKREQFKQQVKISLAEAKCTEQSARILELEDEMEALKRNSDDKCKEIYKRLEMSEFLSTSRQQRLRKIRRELKSSLSEFNVKFAEMTAKHTEMKTKTERLESQVREVKTRNSRLEVEARDHEAERRRKSRDFASMQELIDNTLHRVETAETASEGFKTNYQRERQWRETAEKSIDRVKRELTMTKDRLKNDQKIAKEKMAAQERREVMIKEDFQKAMAELPRQFHEQLYECKSQMARKILALYCAIFVLVAVILSSAWLKFIPTWTLETS